MKKWWKKMTALALSATMIAGLTACGGNDSSKVDNSRLAKENVYQYQDLELPINSDNTSISNMVYLDNKLYILANTYEYDEMGNSNNTFGCYSFNLDGSDQRYVELEKEEREEESNSWMNSTLITDSGYIYGVENSPLEDYSDPENYIYEDRYFLNCWDMTGKLLWSERIDNNKGAEEYSYCNYLLDGGEGKALAIMGGTQFEAVTYTPDGVEADRKKLDNTLFERTGLAYTKADGTLMLITYSEDYQKRYLCSFDINTGTAGEKTELPFSDYAYSLYRGTTSDLLLTDSMGVYTWSIGDTEPKPIMNFINSDLMTYNMSNIQIIDDQHFIAMYNDAETWEQRCAYFTYVDPADIPDKKVLVLGCEYTSGDVKSKVVDFNKSNQEYRITIKDYSSYNSSEDWNAGATKLNNDIISGQMPDIMVLSNMSNYSNYISKGLLADIGKLLEEDAELGQLEYLSNVREAYSVDGKLYAVVPSFCVRTMIAKKSLVGEPETWTMEDVNRVLATMPEGATAFGDMIRGTYLNYMMTYGGNDFVDMATGKCNFTSQSFIDMLEYAKNLPAEYTDDYWQDYDYTYYESQYRENRTLLYDLYISDISSCKYQIKGYIGEDISFVGFPTADSNGSVITSGNSIFAISAKSKNTEGAWQFVRQFLTEEYQNSQENYCLPVLKSAFLEKAKKATERPYWTDEDGNKEYYDDTWYINGEEVILEPFTQEEVDKICEFIYSVNRTDYYNQDILNIITEEAEAFFTGQKSVQEVAEIIQSRVQIFVNENR